MGCSNSKDVLPSAEQPTVSNDPRRSSVMIHVGQKVVNELGDAAPKNIIFVGGPKSGKGAVIEELVESFGVKVISAETLIRTALKKKLTTKPDNGTNMDSALMMAQIKSQPDLVTLEWLFELIRAEVLKYPESVHVIDLLPNSKVILRIKTLFDQAGDLLKKFEESCPVAFAMHLYIDKENLNKQLDSAAHLSTPEGCSDPGGMKDEADSAATKRRHEFFEEALKPVKKYFKESDRLVEVDVSSMSHERIWYKIVRMFATFNLSERQNNSLIVIFVTDVSTVQALIDCHVKVIRISEIVEDPDAPFDLLLECLQCRVSQLGCPNVCYIVDVKNTSLERTQDNEPKKHLIYQLMETSKLSEHLNKYQKSMLTEVDSPQSKHWDNNVYYGYKAPNNFTLLFTEDVSKQSAEVISTTYCFLETSTGS